VAAALAVLVAARELGLMGDGRPLDPLRRREAERDDRVDSWTFIDR